MLYLMRRGTFSEAKGRRKSKVFGDIYMSTYKKQEHRARRIAY